MTAMKPPQPLVFWEDIPATEEEIASQFEDATHYSYFEPTESWLQFYPEKKVTYIHFGIASSNEHVSDNEADWLLTSIESGLAAYSDPFFVFIDMSSIDDSESPSEKSRAVYKQLLSHPQNGITVFYGATPAMLFLIKMLTHLARVHKRVKATNDIAAVARYYSKWKESQ